MNDFTPTQKLIRTLRTLFSVVFAVVGLMTASSHGADGRVISGMAWASAVVIFGTPIQIAAISGVAALLATVYFRSGASGAQAVADATLSFGLSAVALSIVASVFRFRLVLGGVTSKGVLSFGSIRQTAKVVMAKWAGEQATRIKATTWDTNTAKGVGLLVLSAFAALAADANGYFLVVSWALGVAALFMLGARWRSFVAAGLFLLIVGAAFDALASSDMAADVSFFAYGFLVAGIGGGVLALRAEAKQIGIND